MQIEVSNGEIVDKLTILQIKLKYITDSTKRINLLAEYELLKKAVLTFFTLEHPLYLRLLAINEKLWHIEDECRAYEQQQLFDQKFIEIARSVYITNDERAFVKKEINTITGSLLVEEKSYQ
jgi:hypothetical protein